MNDKQLAFALCAMMHSFTDGNFPCFCGENHLQRYAMRTGQFRLEGGDLQRLQTLLALVLSSEEAAKIMKAALTYEEAP